MPPTPIKKKNYTADSQMILIPDEVEDTLNAWQKKNKQKQKKKEGEKEELEVKK